MSAWHCVLKKAKLWLRRIAEGFAQGQPKWSF